MYKIKTRNAVAFSHLIKDRENISLVFGPNKTKWNVLSALPQIF
jgi:hypothetical protein